MRWWDGTGPAPHGSCPPRLSLKTPPRLLFQPGDLLGSYQIRRLIGQGGMGQVYEAHDRLVNRRVAIKVLTVRGGKGRPSDGQPSLRKEAEALAAVHHPGLVTVYGMGAH